VLRADVAGAAGEALATGSVVSSAFWFVSCSAISLSLCEVGVDLALALDGQRAGDLALGASEAGGVVKLAGSVLKAQPEQIAPSGAKVLVQLAVCQVT